MLERSDIDLILLQTLKEDAVKKWWHTPIPAMNDLTPYMMWELRERETVAKLAIGYMKPPSYT